MRMPTEILPLVASALVFVLASTAALARDADDESLDALLSGPESDSTAFEDTDDQDAAQAREDDAGDGAGGQDAPAVITLPEERPDPLAQRPERDRRGRVLEEIIVTATKREAGARDIAGSVGAIGGEQLEKIHAQGMQDYLKLVPGVTLAEQAIDDSIPIIRGIATDTSAGFTALTTGIFLGDMPFQDLFAPQAGSVPDLNPFDLERVEVLKGPQGTLFGSGALAGAIRYIPNKPVLDDWQAKLQLTRATVSQGSPNETIAGAVNVPVGRRAALRGIALGREIGGLYDVRVEDDSGEVIRDDTDADAAEQDAFRVLGRWDVTDRFSLSALHFVQDSTQRDAFAFANQRERPERDNQPFPSPRESRFGGSNLKGRYGWDTVDLLYSGNLLEKEVFSTVHQETALGLGNQDELQAPNTLAADVDGLTNEIHLSSTPGAAGPWTWLAGISRLDYDQFVFQFFTVTEAVSGQSEPPRRPSDVSEAEKASSQLFATIDASASEEALFGELTRLLGQRWELTLGLRAFRTNLAADTVLAGGQVPLLFPGETERHDSFDVDSDGLNPKLSLRYLFSDAMQFYALAAKGFQFGGIQLNPPSPILVQSAESQGFSFAPYDSSTLWNYELGIRSEWLDKRLRLDATAFYMDWTDLQLTVTVPVTPATPATPSVGFGVIANVGAAHSQGLEIALDALPWPNLRITSAASFTEAETDVAFDEDNPDGPVPPGTTLPGAADLQWSNVLALDFGLPFTRHWNTALSLTHTHMGEAPDQIRKLETVGGYDTFDVRLTLERLGGGAWPRLTLAVTNLTDERGVAAQVGTEAARAISFVRPRTVSASLDFVF